MAKFENEFGSCELNDFPGCKAAVVSNKAFIKPEYRGKGYGHSNHRLRCERAKRMGYKLMVCTVREDNEAERKILIKNDWRMACRFCNRTDNGLIELWWKQL